MLPHPTHDRLIALGLVGMAKAFEEQRALPTVTSLTFEERLGLLVDREAVERESKRLVTRLKFANLTRNWRGCGGVGAARRKTCGRFCGSGRSGVKSTSGQARWRLFWQLPLSPSGPAVEMIGAEVLVLGAVFEHVIDRRQQGSGDGADRLLWSQGGARTGRRRGVRRVLPAADS